MRYLLGLLFIFCAATAMQQEKETIVKRIERIMEENVVTFNNTQYNITKLSGHQLGYCCEMNRLTIDGFPLLFPPEASLLPTNKYFTISGFNVSPVYLKTLNHYSAEICAGDKIYFVYFDRQVQSKGITCFPVSLKLLDPMEELKPSPEK